MSSFADSFTPADDESQISDSGHPFGDGYLGFQGSSQGFDSFTTFTENVSVKDSLDDSPVFSSTSAPNYAFGIPPVSDVHSPPGIYSPSAAFTPDQPEISTLRPDANGKVFDDGGFGVPDGPVLPDLSEMRRDDGYALREWRRLNAIQLQEKENREKELRNNIINEAEEYKIDYYTRKGLDSENKKANNREREKLGLSVQVKFHEEANKNYWKAISELIPHEVAAVETRRARKEQEKKAPVLMVQGPKSGKPTDLSRMRQLLLKLKHNTPPHLKPPPPPPPAPAAADKGKDAGKEVKGDGGGSAPAPAALPPPSAPVEGQVAA